MQSPDPNREQAERELDQTPEIGHEKANAKEREHARSPSTTGSMTYPPDKSVVADGYTDGPDPQGSPQPPSSSRRPSDGSNIQAIDEQEGPKEFYHPASVDSQIPIWIPRDELGLGEEEERVCRERGVEASTKGAVMDGKGHVEISQPPPEGGVEL